MFRALAHRNFRLFWAGAFLSNVGTWMQTVAQSWLVLQLTNSPFWLGFDAFAATAPGMVLTLLGGVFADLIDRKRLLLMTQVGAGLTALTLAGFIWAGALNSPGRVWIILVASFVTGCCMSLAAPSYQAITIDLVGREDLANAIALNSTQFQLSRVLGPALAGVAFNVFGLKGCFLANGLSYIAVVWALALVRFKPREAVTTAANDGDESIEVAPIATATTAKRQGDDNKKHIWRDLTDGFRYVSKRPRVFMLLLISAVVSLFGAPYFSLVPLFARDIFHLGETGLALLMGAAGAGAFCAALLLAFLGDVQRKGWFVLGGAAVFSVCLIGFALSTVLAATLAFLFCMGFAIVCSVAVTNILLQQLVTDKMRGRVMSMFILSFIGAMPIGSFLAGLGAEHFGAPHTLATGGLVIFLFAVYTAARNPRLRAH